MKLKKIGIIILVLTITVFTIAEIADASNYSDNKLVDLKKLVTCDQSVKAENMIDDNISTLKKEDILTSIKELDQIIDSFTKDSGDNDSAQQQLKQYRIQRVILQNEYDELISQDKINKQKASQDVLTAKHNFQKQYYNAYLYTEQRKIAVDESEYQKKQLIVEQEKYNIGESTQNAVDLIKNNCELSGNKIKNINNMISLSKENMCNLLEDFNEDNERYNPKFSIDNSDVKLTFSDNLSKLQEEFISSNLDVLKLNESLFNQEKVVAELKKIPDVEERDWKVYALQADKIKIQLKILVANDKSQVAEKYYSYKSIQNNYCTLAEKSMILDTSQNIIDQKYKSGKESELQYLADNIEIQNDRYDIEKIKVDKANILSELDLLSNGIYLE